MSASGRFVLRLSPALHLQLRHQAARRKLSLNQLCESLLTESLQPTAQIISARSIDAIHTRWREDLEGILLFGSRARNTATETSDTDLLLVFRSATPVQRELYRQWDEFVAKHKLKEAASLSPQFVNLPNTPHDAGSLWLEAALDGRVLWEKNGLVSGLLQKIRTLIASGKRQRRLTHGQPYWIRKDSPS